MFVWSGGGLWASKFKLLDSSHLLEYRVAVHKAQVDPYMSILACCVSSTSRIQDATVALPSNWRDTVVEYRPIDSASMKSNRYISELLPLTAAHWCTPSLAAVAQKP